MGVSLWPWNADPMPTIGLAVTVGRVAWSLVAASGIVKALRRR
jgi:hypothetical protein